MKMNRKNGQALILVCMVIVFLVILTAPLFNIAISGKNMLKRAKLEKEAFYLAEGAVEDTINQFITDVANFQVLANTSRYPASGTRNTTYAISPAFPGGANTVSFVNATENSMRTINEGGINIKVKNFIVESTCVHPANANTTVTLKRAVTLRKIATFQHAIFYNDVLELLPGKPMTFAGRVHCNNDIYIASDGSNLTIDSDYLLSAGNIYNRRKDSNATVAGAVNIKVAGTNTTQNMHTDPILDCNNTNWASESQTRWNGTVQSSVHGVTKLAVPVVGSLKPSDGYYMNNSGLKIIGTTITRGGVTLTQDGTTGHGKIPIGTITTTTLYNFREGRNITTTNIDLKKLAGWENITNRSYDNNLPSNGLIYATTNSSDTPVNTTAIRLVNGSEIYSNDAYGGVTSPSGGLTVVSNDPIYVQGNYNTLNKTSTAVICDSVNILSNSWNDSNSTALLSSGRRIAGNTTVNTAFIAGVNTTTSGNYNGGLENYPRLLEDWSGKTLNITGCFIELWNSTAATGAWNTTGVYSAPTRIWSYDQSFASGNALPPLTPSAIEAQKSTWWKQ
ncbi:MAG: hypothetical protein NTY34_06665 [Candidatus Omnitrophica bacterium]|nr:hypothetical protein [Candidatus Omnitrophota bacterium]